jgi:hypothetical protein
MSPDVSAQHHAGPPPPELGAVERIKNSSLPERTKRRLLKAEEKRLRKEIAILQTRVALRETEIAEKTAILAALDKLKEWSDQTPTLERASTSRLHEFERSIEDDAVTRVLDEHTSEGWAEITSSAQAFVIQHDWSAAFANAEDFQSHDFRLPYEVCCFELKISGRRVLTFAVSTSYSDNCDLIISLVVESRDGWVQLPFLYRRVAGDWLPDRWDANTDFFMRMVKLVGAQIKAICVALEAKVATADVIRQPEKLVRARERQGKNPPRDYHVVVLSRQLRPLPRAAAETGRHLRLHFRRGHWRHFETFKTWIRWTLVGDPDLGFIDKHYRL